MNNIEKLALIDCHEPWQALLCLPKTHVDRRGAFAAIHRAPRGRPCLLKCRLISWGGYTKDDRPTRSPFPAYIKADLQFEDRTISTRFYRGKPDDFDALINSVIVIEAVVEDFSNSPVIKSPSFGVITGKIDAVYVGTQGQVSGEVIERAAQEASQNPDAVARAAKVIEESPAVMEVLSSRGRSPRWLVQGLHSPATLAHGDEALEIAKDACVNEVKWSARPRRPQAPAIYCLDESLKELVSKQPETLSESQRAALNTIRKACNAQRPANILLNGDVGSGKTLVFLIALAAIAQASGGRVAVLVPSDLVARQIHANAVNRFPHLFPCLVSGDPAVDASADALASSRMFVGTQALLSRDLPALEAVVVDEQHKLSVDQRNALLCEHTHVIEASATPIPRTLALALFDGWTYAVIKHSPVQKTIHSHVYDQDGRDDVRQLIKEHLQSGKKVVFLYPNVSGSGNSVAKSAKALGERFPGKVVMLHGKLKPAQKIAALEQFREGSCPIIVASTAIEVGVDVPDVGLMVVSGADRFGASQLHQLRGRLVRNGGTGDFAMIAPKDISSVTRKRLQAVADHADGFSLAQKDMELRGFGELLGEMQTGGVNTLFKLSRLTPEDFLPAQAKVTFA